MQEDVWVLRIRAIGIAVALIISAFGGLASFWQGMNNNTQQKVNHAETIQKLDSHKVYTPEK